VGPPDAAGDADVETVLPELRAADLRERALSERMLSMLSPLDGRSETAAAVRRFQQIGTCLERVPLSGVKKLKTSEYKAEGRFPVVDQGQSKVAGWTDDESAVIHTPLPVVVFGDHTRTLKYMDTPFARGADGTQILRPTDDIDPRYFYFACASVDLPSRGYNRHFTLLKEQEIPVPDEADKQKDIAAALSLVEDAVEASRERLRLLEQLNQLLLRKLTRGDVSLSDLDLSAIAAEEGTPS
jgi:hypothetical protein